MKIEFPNDLPKYLQDIRRTNETPENLKTCEPFQLECLRFLSIAEKHKDTAVDLYNNAENSVIREECAIRGEVLHRGYYHPSPIIDIVIGRCDRGNLLKRITKRSKITFKYGFDESGRLVVIKSYSELPNQSKEVIIHNENTVLGISIGDDGTIDYLCEEVYENGKLIELTRASYFNHSNKISDLHKEKYLYDSFGLKTTDMYMYSPDILLLQHIQFNFTHDEEGYLSKYNCVEFNSKNVNTSSANDYWYDVYDKRKI
ncbi:MAG: hypothetical protein E7456_03145 [Ruminococcaceae bacterium]|nr:hypothetical protein [Oscillospiraceae bacterium]